jgi:hypothetical protein
MSIEQVSDLLDNFDLCQCRQLDLSKLRNKHFDDTNYFKYTRKLSKSRTNTLLNHFNAAKHTAACQFASTTKLKSIHTHKSAKSLFNAILEVCDCGKLSGLNPTREQLIVILTWFVGFIPEQCYNTFKGLTPTVKEETKFWQAILQSAQASFITSEQEWDFEDLTKGVYIISLGGPFLIDNRVNHAYKFGESHKNKRGLFGRILDHFNNPNFIYVSAVMIIPTDDPITVEDKMKSFIKKEHWILKPNEYLQCKGRTNAGEKEVFTLSDTSEILKIQEHVEECAQAHNWHTRYLETKSQLSEAHSKLEDQAAELEYKETESEKKDNIVEEMKIQHTVDRSFIDMFTDLSISLTKAVHSGDISLIAQIADKQQKLRETYHAELTSPLPS